MASRVADVRDYRSEDTTGIEAVLLAAFGSAVSPGEIVRFGMEPHRTIVAVDRGAVVGMVAATQYGDAAYVGPMAVHPHYQRRGVGGALLSQLIARLEGVGARSLSLEASDAGAPLYVKYGFLAIDTTHRYVRAVTADARETSATAAPEMYSLDTSHAHLRVASGLDRSVYGYDRGTVLAELASLSRGVRVLIGSSGYAFARTKILGPWIAMDPGDAEALFELSLKERPSIAQVFVPHRNAHANALVGRAGFTQTQSMTHMTRGVERIRRECVYGLATPAFG